MKKYIFILLLSSQLFSQEKSKVIYKNESVVITNGNKLQIDSYNTESRLIAKSKNTYEYLIKVPYDSFNEISDIKGSTLLLKNNKKLNLYSSSVYTFDLENDGIFKSDSKVKQFFLPSVEDNSIIEFSYKNTIKQPHFLSSFRFQNPIKTESTRLEIKCDSTVEIGYKIFGDYQDKIAFSKTSSGNSIIYKWEAKDIPEYEYEEGMPDYSYFTPHIIYYIKNYKFNGKKENFLQDKNDLFLWYSSLIKDINKPDETILKNKTFELIKDKTTDFDKARSIFEWVQKNLHYVAFENGMGGFIPRDAADIYQKLYGDCKDMANLLNQMLNYANLNSNLAWIGTRKKPYSYNDVPTPLVDNHMITYVIINDKGYFLDATDKFCPFSYPSSMIQGKEAMIRKSDKEFIIETVPIVKPEENKISIKMQLSIDNNNIIGEASALVSGLFKSDLLNNLAFNNQKEKEIWKNIVTNSNRKIELEEVDFQKNDYQITPSKAIYKLKLNDGVKTVDEKLILNPTFIVPLKEFLIDIDTRKFSIEKDFAYTYEIQYNYEIPQEYKVEFLPQNLKMDNELGSFDIQYKTINNSIQVLQKIESKKILINKKDFENWNQLLKNLNKQYNQSLILTK